MRKDKKKKENNIKNENQRKKNTISITIKEQREGPHLRMGEARPPGLGTTSRAAEAGRGIGKRSSQVV